MDYDSINDQIIKTYSNNPGPELSNAVKCPPENSEISHKIIRRFRLACLPWSILELLTYFNFLFSPKISESIASD